MKPFYSRPVLLATLAAAALLGAMSYAHAQDANTPKGYLEKGMKVTGLTGDGASPFHIKANYNLFDHGNIVESGVFEEWATGPWTWHRTYTEKKLVANEWSISHANRATTKESNKLDLAKLDARVATPLTDPLYQAVNYSGMDLDGEAGIFAGVTLNCVQVKDAATHAGKIDPDLLYPMLCFDMQNSSLRFVKGAFFLSTYSEFKPLGSRSVATKLDVNYGGKTYTTAEITTLEPLAATDQALVAPSGKTVPQPYVHQATDAPLVPAKLSECAYPIEARNHAERGVVMVPVIIRKDGSVKANGYPMSPFPDLSQAGQDCVGNWKYQPFKLDGEPADVAETFILNFDGSNFKGEPGYASQPPAPKAAK